MIAAVLALAAAAAVPAAGAGAQPSAAAPGGAPAASAAAQFNDYPTEARAEYVFACMASNGNSPRALAECACAIDHIAAVLPYDGYVAAQTVAAMRQTSGERTELFRMPATEGPMRLLRAAEAEAEILCFTPGT